jgi:aspartate/methionine/tyrosine aminotransferase
MSPPARRTSAFGTSIFTEISALAVAHDAVNLGQGFPDFPAPAFIKEAAMRAIREDRNQYAPAAGLPRLRAALAARWERLHGGPVDPDEVTVASGATELLHDAVLAVVEPGDEVIVF